LVFLYYITYVDDARSNTNQVKFHLTSKHIFNFYLIPAVQRLVNLKRH